MDKETEPAQKNTESSPETPAVPLSEDSPVGKEEISAASDGKGIEAAEPYEEDAEEQKEIPDGDAVMPEEAGRGLISESCSDELQDAPASASDEYSGPVSSGTDEAASAVTSRSRPEEGNCVFDKKAFEEAQASISRQMFDLSERISVVSSANSAIVGDLHKVSEETEQLCQWSGQVKITSALSRLFLGASIGALVILIIGMSYLAFMQYRANARLNAAEAALAEALKLQQKRLADYDKHFAELVSKALHGELETRHKTSLQERLNRLRNGHAEQKMYRKNSGDWFLAVGQSEQHIADPEIIELLNHAFAKSGKQLVTRTPAPPHKAWGILRSNGRGGTEIVITSEVSP